MSFRSVKARTAGGPLQLHKLRCSLIEKLNSLRNESMCKFQNLPLRPVAVDTTTDNPKCVDSVNQYIIPDLSEPLENLDGLRSKLGNKLASYSRTVVTVKAEILNVKGCSSAPNDEEPNVETKRESSVSETEPALIESSVSQNGGVYFRSLKKALVEKLNTTQGSSVNLTKSEEQRNFDVLDDVKEPGSRQEQANILERLQANIRDKIQNEIWVDNLVSLVSSLPENHRKTVLDKVKQKLSIPDSQFYRVMPSRHEEGNVNEVEQEKPATDVVTTVTGGVRNQDYYPELPCNVVLSKDIVQDSQSSGITGRHRLLVDASKKNTLTKKKYGKLFFCCNCNFESKSKRQIEAHVSRQHGFSSNICQKEALDVHVECQSELRNFTCALCDYRVASKLELLRHMTKHIAKRSFTCEFCGKFFASACSLLNHINSVHIGLDMISCNMCQYKSPSAAGLRHHQAIKHNHWKTFKCPICKETITQRTSFMLHMKKHTGEHLQCKSCRDIFLTRALLDKHRQVRPSKYKCRFCTLAFPSKCLLGTHKVFHNKLNPYCCLYCGFSCGARASLTRHINEIHVANLNAIKTLNNNSKVTGLAPVIKLQ